MSLRIEYRSRDFPAVYSLSRNGTLTTTWDELLWAAITIGRPSTYHVFRHGQASFHEAIFRLALVRMAIEQTWTGHLQRTKAFAALDPTEKGMVSYFLGMALCKLFASQFLGTPWLLHLDVFRQSLNPFVLGRSRPDLVGQDVSGNWHAFESKGRASVPTSSDKAKAKIQAQRLVSINNRDCSLQVASFAFFRAEVLEYYWRDPEPDSREDPIRLPRPGAEWRYYYEPALSLASGADSPSTAAERELADVTVQIHPEVHHLLLEARWVAARRLAIRLHKTLASQGYKPDGVKVIAGERWSKPYDPTERS
jgi:hypothetical protein